MVRRYPWVSSIAPPLPNASAINYVGIALPVKGNNDDIAFIIDNHNDDKEDADEEPEEGSMPLVDQYIDELEAYKKLKNLKW